MDARQPQQTEFVFDQFLGMDLRSAKGSLPPGKARYVRNLEPFTYSGTALNATKGHTTLFTPGYNVKSLTRYVNGSTKYLIVHRDDGGGTMYRQTEGTGWSPTSIGASADSDGARFVLTPTGTLIWTNGTGALQAWGGSGSATDAGLAAPDGTITLDITTTGVVDGTDKTKPYYQVMATFVNSRGVESPPGPASALTYPVSKTINISYLETVSNVPASVTEVRFYLFGGDLGDFYYIGSDTSVGHGVYPTAAATYSFNLQDSDVSTIPLKRNVAAPPNGLDILCIRQNRLWAGTSGDNNLYFSGYNAYEGFSQTSENEGYDGGVLELLGGSDDGLVALASFATLLVVARERSVYTLYGNQTSNFSMSKRADVGVVNRDAVAVSPTAVYFAGRDYRIYKLVDGEPQRVSTPVDSAFEDQTSWAAVRLTWNQETNSLIVSYRSATDTYTSTTTYIYYEQFDAWFQEEGLNNRAIARLPSPTERRDEIIFIPYTGSTIKKAFATTTERSIWWQSGEFRYTGEGIAPADLSAFEEVLVEGYTTGPASPSDDLRLSAIYEVAGMNTATYFTITQDTGLMIMTRTQRGLVGEWLSMILANKIAGGYISRIAAQVCFYRGRR